METDILAGENTIVLIIFAFTVYAHTHMDINY